MLGVEGMEFAADENGDRRYSAFNFHSGREDILPYLRGMLREIEQKSAGYEVVCQDLLEVLVVKLMRHTDFSLTVTPAQQSSKECAEARRYIDSNFKENISLDQLAELTHVNKYYLVHSFSKEYGVSPINYLIGRRIEESRYLLADTNHSLSRFPHAGFFLPQLLLPNFRKPKASALWNTGSGSGPRERDIRNNNSCTFVHLSSHTIVRICFNRL
ncbi:MAG: AraC family transcriptional regulator [Ruthenibacterium lactatiformans]